MVLYVEAGWPTWNVVGWVLRSGVLAKRRAEGGSSSLTPHEVAGHLAVDRLVAGLAYARCMILTGLGIAIAVGFVIPGRALAAGIGRGMMYGIGFALGSLPAAAQLVILVWFSSQAGRYKTRLLRTTSRSLRTASIFAWVIGILGGIVFALFTYRTS